MDSIKEVSAADAKPLWKSIVDFPLVAMVVALALFIGANIFVKLVNDQLPPIDKVALTAVKTLIGITIVTIVYKLAIRRLGERPHDDLPVAGAPRLLGLGLLGGFLLFSLIVGIAGLLDVYNIVGQGSAAELAMIALTIAIVPGFMEELLFRGILFRWLEQFGGSWFALALTSAMFGMAHYYNPNATAFSSFAIAIEAGILLGGLYMLTRSLWAPIGLHAAWNFTQGFVWDVPVSGIDQNGMVEAQLSGPELLSGGAFGLEASLIALVLATAAGVWLCVRAVRQGELIRPWWVRRKLAAAVKPAVEVAVS